MTFEQRHRVTLSPSSFTPFRCSRPPFGLFLLFALCMAVMTAHAQAEPGSTCYLILIPGLQPEDLTHPQLPALAALSRQSASGWMVCRTARIPSSTHSPSSRELLTGQCLTLGSGARAAGLSESERLVEQPRHGDFAPASFTSTTLQAILDRLARLDHPVTVGALGDLIHSAAGMTVLLVPSEEIDIGKAATLLTMDSQGHTDLVGNLSPEDASAFGTGALHSPYIQFPGNRGSLHPDHSALVVVVFGELIGEKQAGMPLNRPQPRSQALKRLNTLLTGLLKRLATVSDSAPATPFRWLLLSPGPADANKEREDRLAPVWMGGNDVVPGVLTSASTHRIGLVVNTDLLPTLADVFHQPLPLSSAGRPFTVVPASQPVTPVQLLAQHDRLLWTARLQDTLGGLPTVQLLLVLSGWLLLTRRHLPRLAIASGFAVLSLPLGMLLLPPIAPGSLPGAGLLLALFALLTALAGYLLAGRREGALRGVYTLSVVLLIALLGDLLTGKHLLEQAWMSYSVVEGARYYGIGNEYMGTAIGAACILPAAGYSLGLLPLLTLAMGLGRFGAKVGAIPSAGASFACLALVRLRGRLRWQDVAVALVGIGMLLGLFAFLDAWTGGGQQAHFVRALAGTGGDTLPGIAHRKLALEGYLLLHSPWSLTLLTCLACLWHLYRLSPGLLRHRDLVEERSRYASWVGLMAGAVVSLLCNDSGVTAATMILLYAWVWLLVQAAALPHFAPTAKRENGGKPATRKFNDRGQPRTDRSER